MDAHQRPRRSSIAGSGSVSSILLHAARILTNHCSPYEHGPSPSIGHPSRASREREPGRGREVYVPDDAVPMRRPREADPQIADPKRRRTEASDSARNRRPFESNPGPVEYERSRSVVSETARASPVDHNRRSLVMPSDQCLKYDTGPSARGAPLPPQSQRFNERRTKLSPTLTLGGPPPPQVTTSPYGLPPPPLDAVQLTVSTGFLRTLVTRVTLRHRFILLVRTSSRILDQRNLLL